MKYATFSEIDDNTKYLGSFSLEDIERLTKIAYKESIVNIIYSTVINYPLQQHGQVQCRSPVTIKKGCVWKGDVYVTLWLYLLQ